MGGAASKKKGVSSIVDIKSRTYNEIINDKCSMERLDAANGSKIFNIKGKNYDYKLKYCYVSQRGYYPQSLNKANQDSYSIQETWYGDESIHMFGIYDGHGETGDYCSHFAALYTPLYFHKQIDNMGGFKSMSDSDIKQKFSDAFVTTNIALHESSIDDTLSGTTAITVFVKGDKLVVANVGDSRAIIASDIDGNLKSSPLSIDQTPFRKDERTRLKKRGAKIMTMDQIEGAEPIHDNWGEDGETGNEIGEGDPPRVWDRSLQMPGCAFTRSIGDSFAESIGVFAEPEILTWDIQPNDKFVIIASDGVFEFLTSQAVVDMVAGFADPLTAAKHVVSEAYRLWLTYDERTDDISIIIINFEDIRKKSKLTNDSPDSPNEIRKADVDYQKFVKPIRSIRRKDRKKKLINESIDDTEMTDADFNSIITEKSPTDATRINELINSNFMFQKLTVDQKELLSKVITFKEVRKDEVIINEGDDGNEMFIIDSGEYDVYKKDDKGQLVLVFTYSYPGAFGELSLIYGEPRAATIKAKRDGKLWCLRRRVFKAIMTSKTNVGNPIVYLKSIPVLSECTYYQLQRLCEYSLEIVVPAAEKIIDRNTESKYELYIVVSGSVQVTLNNQETSIREATSFFAAFETGAGTKSVKNVTSISETKLLVIPRKAIIDILGNELIAALSAALNKSPRYKLTIKESIFDKDVYLTINKKDYELKEATVLIGDFSYIASYQNISTKKITSVKVVSKYRASKSKIDASLVQEKKYLMTLSKLKDSDTFITSAISTYQDDKITMLFYDDYYVSDLSFLIYQTDIPIISKQYFSSCIFLGIKYLHSKGLFHRFINADNIYITNKGIAKIGGLLYAKEMSGKKSYTICGEPEYFAPEIILQQGYNYSVDLWAYGILLYELFEGKLPFGQENIDEVQLYKLITSYQGNLEFTIQDTNTTNIIQCLLNPTSNERLGFKSSKEIMNHNFFKGTSWENYNNTNAPSSLPSIEGSSLFIHDDQESISSPLYDNF